MRVSVCVAAPSLAQNIEPAFQQARDAREAARQARDVEEYARYTTEDFLSTRPNGDMITRAQRLAAIERNENTDPLQTTDERVRSYGTTVIVTWRANDLRFTAVWVKQDNQWRVAGLHVSGIANP